MKRRGKKKKKRGGERIRLKNPDGICKKKFEVLFLAHSHRQQDRRSRSPARSADFSRVNATKKQPLGPDDSNIERVQKKKKAGTVIIIIIL